MLQTGRTPFHYACGQGLPETCQVLLDREKKANILNRTVRTVSSWWFFLQEGQERPYF